LDPADFGAMVDQAIRPFLRSTGFTLKFLDGNAALEGDE
jgi:hypothetical protein